MRTGKRFSRGGSGQTAWWVKAQGGFDRPVKVNHDAIFSHLFAEDETGLFIGVIHGRQVADYKLRSISGAIGGEQRHLMTGEFKLRHMRDRHLDRPTR